jgi:tetratricopeptide (TPR) repeat protein
MYKLLCCVVILLFSLFSQPVLALMPPHVTETTPRDGGVLIGETIILEGYSLSATDPGTLHIMDATTGTEVEFSPSTECHSEARRFLGCLWPLSPPGSCQSRCEMHITLNHTSPGHWYILTFLEETVHFTALAEAPEPVNATQGVSFDKRAIELHNKAIKRLVEEMQQSNLQNSYQEIIDILDEIMMIDRSYYMAHVNKANVYVQVGMLEHAIAAMKQAVELKPDFAEGVMGLGSFHARSGQRAMAQEYYRQAIALYDQRLVRSPDSTSDLVNRTFLLGLTTDKATALEEITRIAQQYPDDEFVQRMFENFDMFLDEYIEKDTP